MADKHEASPVVLGKTKGKPVRFSYLHVFTPHLNRESKRHEFSLQVLIPKTNTEDYAAAVAAVEAQKKILWPTGKLPPSFHNPIKDGDTFVNQKGEEKFVPGHWIITAKTDAFERNKVDGAEMADSPKAPVQVAGTTRGADGKLELLGSADVKSGDWGRVSVDFKSYKTGDGGVGCYLNSMQKVQTGDPLGSGKRSAADEFDDYEDEADEADVLG